MFHHFTAPGTSFASIDRASKTGAPDKGARKLKNANECNYFHDASKFHSECFQFTSQFVEHFVNSLVMHFVLCEEDRRLIGTIGWLELLIAAPFNCE